MKKAHFEKLLFFGLALVLVSVILYSGLQILESTVLFAPKQMEVQVRKTVTRDGVDYYPRQDITTVLVMGIDQTGPARLSEVPNDGKAVDMIAVVIVDEKAQNYTVLNINRDTMLEMPKLNEEGREDGIFFGQLAYSHTYGRGGADSCENTRKAVSNLLYGIKLDYYVAMNMDAVAILNDAVGGVTVQVQDDFSGVDSSLPMGIATLTGEQALSFVQSRGNVGDELNLSRMERQKEYMKGFAAAFESRMEASDSFLLKTYNAAAPYLVSDLPVSTLTAMMERYAGFSLADTISLPGENKLGREYYEFYPDAEALETLVMKLFYAPK